MTDAELMKRLTRGAVAEFIGYNAKRRAESLKSLEDSIANLQTLRNKLVAIDKAIPAEAVPEAEKSTCITAEKIEAAKETLKDLLSKKVNPSDMKCQCWDCRAMRGENPLV